MTEVNTRPKEIFASKYAIIFEKNHHFLHILIMNFTFQIENGYKYLFPNLNTTDEFSQPYLAKISARKQKREEFVIFALAQYAFQTQTFTCIG